MIIDDDHAGLEDGIGMHTADYRTIIRVRYVPRNDGTYEIKGAACASAKSNPDRLIVAHVDGTTVGENVSPGLRKELTLAAIRTLEARLKSAMQNE